MADYQQKASEKLRKFTSTLTRSEALSSEQKTVEEKLESNRMEGKASRHVEAAAADLCSHGDGTEPPSTGNESTAASRAEGSIMWIAVTKLLPCYRSKTIH